MRFRPSIEALEDRLVPSTLTVTSAADNGAGSLRADIAAARSGDTIVFAPSLDGQTITLTSGELLINKNLTITGPGADQLTVSGNHTSRVFELSSKTKPQVTLSGLTLSNGDAVVAAGSTHTNDGYGGAIYNGGTLTISNSTLSNNFGVGGCIENNGALTLINSTLSGNSAGGGTGGAIDIDTGTVSINGCTLSDNSAGIGGAIFNYVSCTLTLTNSILSSNTATGNVSFARGGAIDNQGTTTITGCTLTGNTGTGRVSRGGAIYNESTLAVINSTLTNNSVSGYGGGIYNRLGVVTISGSTLTNNSAGGQGGGIYNASYPTSSFTNTVTVENFSNIVNNSAPVGSGADVYNYEVLQLDASSVIGILDGNPAVPI